MTGFILAVLGFVTATIVVAVQRRLRSKPWRAWPLESDGVPDWVNDGRPFEQRFVEAIHFAQWETQLDEERASFVEQPIAEAQAVAGEGEDA